MERTAAHFETLRAYDVPALADMGCPGRLRGVCGTARLKRLCQRAELHSRGENSTMTQQIWVILCTVLGVGLIGLMILWLRMPVFRWSCRRCKKIVSVSRFRPSKCSCGTDGLVAYFCKDCGSWNTTPKLEWHCVTCSSKDISLAVEYKFATGMWRTRNVNAQHSFFHGRTK
jgi:hypothetical protein